MKVPIKVLMILAVITVSVMPLTGCSPSIKRDDAEKELISFMLNFIIQQKIGGSTNYIQTSGQPWLDTPLNPSLIIFAPPNEKTDKAPWEQLNINEPIKVWWYADNKLVEGIDKQQSIQNYEAYISNPNSYGRYEFGILSISTNNRKANIYISDSRGPDVAAGMICTIRRNDSGKWQFKDSDCKLLWMS